MHLPSNIKPLVSNESFGHRHRFYKVSYSELKVAFIILHILTETIFFKKSIQQLQKSSKLHHDTYHRMMINTASICVKDKQIFHFKWSLDHGCKLLRKRINIKPLTVFRMQNFKRRHFWALSHKAISLYLQGTPGDVKNGLHSYSSKRRTLTWALQLSAFWRKSQMICGRVYKVDSLTEYFISLLPSLLKASLKQPLPTKLQRNYSQLQASVC